MTKCAICRESYKKWRLSQKVCGKIECAEAYAVRDRQKRERKELRARKERLKTLSQWLREAQAAFNAYIRERDSRLPCISCGRYHEGAYDAGHYRSVGAAPALRFHEDNVHKQCVPCNQFKSGNAIEYRIRLIQRIGLARVEFLEQYHPPAKYTIEDAKQIKAEYREKVKRMCA